MAKAPEKLVITLEKAKVFDEMLENVSDLAELLELVPDWSRGEADALVRRIVDRQKGWVSIGGVE